MTNEPDEQWPFQSDGAPEYQPIGRVDALVRCGRCWAVIEGDAASQTAHRTWHSVLVRNVEAAARPKLPQRYAGAGAPE
jgi:hypothetical protein